MPGRANGEGSVYRRPDGLWSGQLSYTDEATGKDKRHTVYGKTVREVRAKLAAGRERLAAGAPVRDATVTVSRWVEEWITKALASSPRSASTKQTYAILARCHLQTATVRRAHPGMAAPL